MPASPIDFQNSSLRGMSPTITPGDTDHGQDNLTELGGGVLRKHSLV